MLRPKPGYARKPKIERARPIAARNGPENQGQRIAGADRFNAGRREPPSRQR